MAQPSNQEIKEMESKTNKFAISSLSRDAFVNDALTCDKSSCIRTGVLISLERNCFVALIAVHPSSPCSDPLQE